MRIVPARLTHVGPLALNMRAADKRECEALGRSPKEALRLGLRASLHVLSAIEDGGEVTAMFGLNVVSALGGTAAPWFLGTDRVFDHPRELLRDGRRILAWWRSGYPNLENIVAADNAKAIRLLRHWGFEIGGASEMHGGVAFLPFHFPAIQALRNAA